MLMFYRFFRICGSVSRRKLYSLPHNRSFTTCTAVCWDLVLVKGPNSSFAYKIKTIPIITLIIILERFFQFCNLSGSYFRSEWNKKFKLIFPYSTTFMYDLKLYKYLLFIIFQTWINQTRPFKRRVLTKEMKGIKQDNTF